MLDHRVRSIFDPSLQRIAAALSGRGVPAGAVTIAGLAVGVGACLAVGLGRWWLALALWCANRALDGLDGAVARRTTATDAGGFLDIVSDFAVYGGFVVAVAVARPDARLACAALLWAYYLNGTAFLALSSLAERRRQRLGDERSLRFVAGLTESTETFLAYVLLCVFPTAAEAILWTFAGAVTVTVGQRTIWGLRLLRTTEAG